MKTRFFPVYALIILTYLAPANCLWSTSNYEYGKDEYVTIANGISPDGKFAIAAHGEGESGYDNFYLYLYELNPQKRIGPLEEIGGLDTGAGAFAAKWTKKSKDSIEVTIIYRVDRHLPLKSMTYRLAKGRAFPLTPNPVDVDSDSLIEYWGKWCSSPRPTLLRIGTPKS